MAPALPVTRLYAGLGFAPRKTKMVHRGLERWLVKVPEIGMRTQGVDGHGWFVGSKRERGWRPTRKKM